MLPVRPGSEGDSRRRVPNVTGVSVRSRRTSPGVASEIEKDIARSREKIEARYAARIADLQARGDKEIADFERAQRGGLANSAVKTAWFFESMGQVPARGYTQDANGLWLPDKLVAETEKRIADKKEKVLAALEQAVKSLERERDYILKVGLADRERQLKEHALKGGPEAKRGLLCGIAYGRDKRAALLDRIIIHEGEMSSRYSGGKSYSRRTAISGSRRSEVGRTSSGSDFCRECAVRLCTLRSGEAAVLPNRKMSLA